MELLIAQYSGLLWTLVQNYLDNPEDQKDCVNETFEQFYYNRKCFTPEKGTLSAYLAEMLRKRAITLYRKNSVRKWEELTDGYETGDSQIEKMAENLDLQQALSALKPDELELIRMKYYEGMTVQEIAASLNISYETAKKRHQRTLSKLQKMLLLVLAMVLAGLLTACAIRILQHFGIIPGYGINQNQEERVYVLEEPVEDENEMRSLFQRYYDRTDISWLAEPETSDRVYWERRNRMEDLQKEYLTKTNPDRFFHRSVTNGKQKENFRHLYYVDAGRYTLLGDQSDYLERAASMSYHTELKRIMLLFGEIPRKTMIRHIIILCAPYLSAERLNENLKAFGYQPLDENHTQIDGTHLDWLLIRILKIYADLFI